MTETPPLLTLLEKAAKQQTKLPMLDIVFDRLIRLYSTSIRTFTSESIDVDIIDVKHVSFADYMGQITDKSIISIIKAVEWNNYILTTTTPDFIFMLIDLLFGGKKSEKQESVKEIYTSIETNIARNALEIFLKDLTQSFDQITSISFMIERTDTNPKFAQILRADDSVVLLRLKIHLDNREGILELALPYITLEPIKKILMKSFLVTQGNSKNPMWLQHIEQQVLGCNLELTCYIESCINKLIDVRNIKVGSIIALDKLDTENVYLKLDNMKLMSGKLGKSNNKIAFQVLNNINLKKDGS